MTNSTTSIPKSVLCIELVLKETHLGTAFSNHTSKMSSLVPSKSQIRGFIGAALGISFKECQHLDFGYAFHWQTSPSTQMCAMNREVIKKITDTRTDILSDRTRYHTIDYIEHLYNREGSRLTGMLYIEIPQSKALEWQNYIENPVFPLFLGKVENFVKVNSVLLLENPIKYTEKVLFSHFFVGESDIFLLTERLVDCMSDYRTPAKLESVYSQAAPIEGFAKNGHYKIDDRNVCIW